ncbi:hypothetical protein PGB90_006132 [Kerria lacca]
MREINPIRLTYILRALQITNSMESDQGKYECVAENSVGTEYSQPVGLYVKAVVSQKPLLVFWAIIDANRVISSANPAAFYIAADFRWALRRVAPQFSITPPSFKEVKLGDDFNITCVAIGSPMPYVRWQKDPQIDITPEDQLPVGRNILEIKNAQTSESYTCIAASSLGTVNATTVVKVQSLPLPPTDLKITEVTATSVRLSWMHTTPSEILYYVIHYKPRHTNQPYVEISGIITLYYTVRNLSPYTEYEFYVMGMNNLGRGPPSPSAVVITGETGMMHIKNNIDFYFNRFEESASALAINKRYLQKKKNRLMKNSSRF